jgi:hypothetical protein
MGLDPGILCQLRRGTFYTLPIVGFEIGLDRIAREQQMVVAHRARAKQLLTTDGANDRICHHGRTPNSGRKRDSLITAETLRVPVERDHGFRWKMITQSGGT